MVVSAFDSPCAQQGNASDGGGRGGGGCIRATTGGSRCRENQAPVINRLDFMEFSYLIWRSHSGPQSPGGFAFPFDLEAAIGWTKPTGSFCLASGVRDPHPLATEFCTEYRSEGSLQIGLEVQYKALFDRKNTREVLAWGVPAVMLAAQMAVLPRIHEANTFSAVLAVGAGGSCLGFLSYQLFNHHKHRKHLDERWLLLLEQQHAGLLLHAPRQQIEEALDRSSPPHESVHAHWVHQISATTIWSYSLMLGTVLPLIVMGTRLAGLIRARHRRLR